MFVVRNLRFTVITLTLEVILALILLAVGGVLATKIYSFQIQRQRLLAAELLNAQRQQVGHGLRADQAKIQQALNIALLPDQVNQYVGELEKNAAQRHVTVSVADISALAGDQHLPLQTAQVRVLADGSPDQLLLFLRDIVFSGYLSNLGNWSLNIAYANHSRLPTPSSLTSPQPPPSVTACTPWRLEAMVTLFVRQPRYSL